MSAPATQVTLQDDPGPPATDAQGSCQVLRYIINVGADVVRLLHEHAIAHAAQQATAPAQQATAFAQQAAPPAQHTAAPAPQPADPHQAKDTPPAPAPAPAPPPAPDALIRVAASFDQVTRGIRRSIMLTQHLDAPKRQHPARPPAQHPTQDRTTARKRIIRAVEDVIQRPPDNDECDDAEVLLSDFRERMDTPDLEDDIASRPAEDIIKDILRDLGLAALPGSRPWKRRTPADIADLNARAAAASSPRQPSPGLGPQAGHPAAAQSSPDPADQHDSGAPKPGPPAAPARAPVHPGHTLPRDPAEAVAFVLHHTDSAKVRWRPPPGD